MYAITATGVVAGGRGERSIEDRAWWMEIDKLRRERAERNSKVSRLTSVTALMSFNYTIRTLVTFHGINPLMLIRHVTCSISQAETIARRSHSRRDLTLIDQRDYVSRLFRTRYTHHFGNRGVM